MNKFWLGLTGRILECFALAICSASEKAALKAKADELEETLEAFEALQSTEKVTFLIKEVFVYISTKWRPQKQH